MNERPIGSDRGARDADFLSTSSGIDVRRLLALAAAKPGESSGGGDAMAPLAAAEALGLAAPAAAAEAGDETEPSDGDDVDAAAESDAIDAGGAGERDGEDAVADVLLLLGDNHRRKPVRRAVSDEAAAAEDDAETEGDEAEGAADSWSR
jgi:hypothetical protein